MFNITKIYHMYAIIDNNNEVICCKHLTKAAEITKIPTQTLRNHFTKGNNPYKRGDITIYKAKKTYLKAKNRGENL